MPLHVLTGFLGSGKTTLLAELLRAPAAGRLGVLVNEVGDLPLDADLLERVDDDVLALPSGCVCCSVRGQLHDAVRRVLAQGPEQLVLETTGLADPAPILDALVSDPVLAALVRPGAVIAVVDALRLEELLEREPELRAQLELADRVALTKTDLAPHRLDDARALLATEAPGREVREVPHGRVDPAWLLAAPPLAGLRDARTTRAWLHHRPHDEAPGFRSHAVQLDEPADIAALQLWLRLVTQLDGPRLLRVKLLARCRVTGDAFALQSAGRSLSPPRRLARAPAGLRGVQAVLIERGLPDPVVARMRAALAQAARAERAAG